MPDQEGIIRMTELHYDDDAAEQLLALYETHDVVQQRWDFLRALGPRPDERVLDVGSGPGFLTYAIAEAVGASGTVDGIDISDPLLAVARTQCARQSWVNFHHASATQLPFDDHTFDAAISTQVLEYVSEVDAALAEIHRVVRPAGRVVIVDTDWDSIVWHSPNRERMKRVLEAWEEHAAYPRLPRTMASRLHSAGFCVHSQRVVPLFNHCYDPDTYSNRVIDLIVPFVSGRKGISDTEAMAWARELREAGKRGEYFFSLNRYLFLAKRE